MLESLNTTSLCNTNTMAFMEELLNLEYLQDTTNEVGNFLTEISSHSISQRIMALV